MAAITKSWSSIADAAVDPDSPVTTGLMTGLRDNIIVVREWLGESFFAGAVQDHNHDGVNSASIPVGPNLLRNGSFEDGEAGWTVSLFTGGAKAITTSNHRHGARALELTSTVLANGGAEALADEYFPCAEGEFICLQGHSDASAINISSLVELLWYDNAKGAVSASTVYSSSNTPTAVTLFSGCVAAPSTARFFRVQVTGGVPATGSATGTIRFDGLRAHQIPLQIVETGSSSLGSGATWTPTAPGLYMIALTSTVTSGWQIFVSAAWRAMLSQSGTMWCDGANQRVSNGSGSTQTLYWQRLA